MSTPQPMTQFQRYMMEHKRLFDADLKGPMLEYGSGSGGFLIEAHAAGVACYGVEVEKQRAAQFNARIARLEKPELEHFFRLYDGNILPFNARYFGAVYSWFVLEHVHDIWTSLREIVRVTKPGGTIYLKTQDARNCYEGHCDMPWPLYFPKTLIRPFLEEMGREPDYIDYICNEVFYVTTPQIASTLRSLGCEIVYASADNPPTYLDTIDITTPDEARAYARKMKKILDDGAWERPKENLVVMARRLDAAPQTAAAPPDASAATDAPGAPAAASATPRATSAPPRPVAALKDMIARASNRSE